MAMRFTAEVKNRQVVIDDLPLADGEVVDVILVRQEDVYVLTEEEEREIELGEAEADAGLGRPAHEFFAELATRDAVRSPVHATRGARRETGNAKVGAARPGTKPASGRSRSRR